MDFNKEEIELLLKGLDSLIRSNGLKGSAKIVPLALKLEKGKDEDNGNVSE